MVFKTKIAFWFHALAITLCIVTLCLVCLAVAGRLLVLYIAAGFMLLFTALLLVPLWVNTKYVLEDTALCITSGLFRRRIPYQSILAVRPIHDAASAPALSLDRVLIRYQNKHGTSSFVAVSPKDKAGFVRQLACRR